MKRIKEMIREPFVELASLGSAIIVFLYAIGLVIALVLAAILRIVFGEKKRKSKK